MPILILEGTEKTGKTSFYNYLIKRADNLFPFETVLLKRKIINSNNLFKNEAIAFSILEFLSEKFPNDFFLLDRGIPSGLVYNKFFNRGTNPYVSSEKVLEKLIRRNSLFFIFLKFKSKKILEKKINKFPDELLNDTDDIWAIQEAFEVLFSKLIPSDLIFIIEISKLKFTKRDFDFYYQKLNKKLLEVFKRGLK